MNIHTCMNACMSLHPFIHPCTGADIVLVDSGGAEKRGHTRGNNVSVARKLIISLINVNDAPTFSLKPSVTILARGDVAWYSEQNTAFEISPGPANEANQSINFSVMLAASLPNNVFVSSPRIFPNGTFEVKISSTSTSFETLFTLWLQDNGGTANGGSDTSAARNLSLFFIASPVAVTSLTITQSVEQQLDVAWMHVDTTTANTTLGRVISFVANLTRDCSALTLGSPEAAACADFSILQSINIEGCASSACAVSFRGLDPAVRYIASGTHY